MKISIRKLALIGASAAMLATSSVGAMAASVQFNFGPGYSSNVWGGHVRYPRSYGYNSGYNQCHWEWRQSCSYGYCQRQKVWVC